MILVSVLEKKNRAEVFKCQIFSPSSDRGYKHVTEGEGNIRAEEVWEDQEEEEKMGLEEEEK